MISFMAKAQSVEELKMFLEVESLDETQKLEKCYVVIILHIMNLDFGHLRDQLLIGHKVQSKETLRTQLF